MKIDRDWDCGDHRWSCGISIVRTLDEEEGANRL